MQQAITPVILGGGSGTRLWPTSRASYPKQFARIFEERSLFQATVGRLSVAPFRPPVIVTRSEFRFLVVEQMAGIGCQAGSIIIEPDSRNTAPAVLAAAIAVMRGEPDAILLVCPSDHLIADDERFREAIRAGLPAAGDGRLVTFGIRPDRPETGYGWLGIDRLPDSGEEPAPIPLRRFVEKPDRDTAAALLAGGRHLWNSGIFLFSARAIVAAFESLQATLLEAVSAALAGARQDLAFLRLDPEPWAGIDAISLDHAVMERAGNLAVVPLDCGWSDVGAWDAVARASEADRRGVALQGPAHAIDCRDSFLRAEHDDQILVGIGLRNIIAVSTHDAVLVADIRDSQRVREAVEQLRAEGVRQATGFLRCFRPWGWYETLALGDRFQVKRIMVRPGGMLSLQSHLHRAEHWVVVEGTARVTAGGEVTLLSENQSIYIPLGTVHRLENPGRLPLHLIEVQSGAYLGEDDIVRLDDAYARP
jgi:mannose-1-phosphate guanylyltransferase/mannose-6-phosphate isomerase